MACRVGEHPKRQRLYLRLWWRGRETWERTGRSKTQATREELARVAALITAEIRAGLFTAERYLHYFPDGARRVELAGAVPTTPTTPATPAAACPTVSEYYATWITRFEVPGVRPSRARDYRLNLVHYVLPRIGNPPKTSKSERTIKLPPAVVAVLREIIPLHVDPAAYLFTNAKNGGPIDQSEFAKTHWQSAIRAKAVKPRKFYATRSTFISLTVPKTRNLKALVDYCGTSVAMIEQHYGRYMGDEPDWLMIGEPTTARAQTGGLAGRILAPESPNQ